MTVKRTRHNGEGSIYEQRPGLWAAYVWVDKPDGTRGRKYVYGQEREEVHAEWVKLQKQAREAPMATKVPTLAEFVAYWHGTLISLKIYGDITPAIESLEER